MARSVDFELGGQVRQFRLTAASLEKLESALGLSFIDLPERRISATITNVILWAALLWKEPQMTREQVAGWIDETDYATCMTKAIEIYGVALETFAVLKDPQGAALETFAVLKDPQGAAPSGGTGTPPDAVPSASG